MASGFAVSQVEVVDAWIGEHLRHRVVCRSTRNVAGCQDPVAACPCLDEQRHIDQARGKGRTAELRARLRVNEHWTRCPDSAVAAWRAVGEEQTFLLTDPELLQARPAGPGPGCDLSMHGMAIFRRSKCPTNGCRQFVGKPLDVEHGQASLVV
jgi:hypothetical protein